MQPPISITSGVTTTPFLVNPDGWVIIEAGNTSVTVQYTVATTTDVASGAAVYNTVGTFTGFTAIRADEELAEVWVKLTTSGGSATYHVEGQLSRDDRLTLRGYKRTSMNGLNPTYALDSSGNVTGLVGPSGENIYGGAPTRTWAQIQALTGMAVGQRVNASDINNGQFVWDGTYWKPAGRILLLQQLTGVAKTDADTANQLALSYTLPAGLFSVGSTLSFDLTASVNAVVAVNKNLTLTLGGVGVGTFQISTTSMSTRVIGSMLAVSNAAVQAWWPGNAAVIGQSTGDNWVSAAVNPLVQNTLALNLSWATAGSGTNTLTLRNAKVWIDP